MRLRLPADSVWVAETEVRRSRFLARVARADSEDAARAAVADARAEHPTARHHCSAFIVDVPDAQPIERSSDDGEPTGTAGTPMLEVLRAADLTQVVAVVTRYFGGTLLGIGGLARAYADATAAALQNTPRVRPVAEQLLAVTLGPEEAGRIEGALLARGSTVVSTTWGAQVQLILATTDPSGLGALVREVAQREVDLAWAGTRTIEIPVRPPNPEA
ncbi:MAG: YigZ family protein [Propioniciclava sp.]